MTIIGIKCHHVLTLRRRAIALLEAIVHPNRGICGIVQHLMHHRLTRVQLRSVMDACNECSYLPDLC